MSKIKVLIIDQMGILKSERKKYEELSRFDDLDIVVIVPKNWRFNYRQFFFEAGYNGKYKLISTPVAFLGYGHRSFYLGPIIKILKNYQPDIIHLFQEPYSFFAAQIVFFRNLFLPKTKILFITWQNMNYENYPFFFSKLYSFIENYTYKNASCATPITQGAKEILLKRGFKGKCHVLNWGIDLDLFNKRNPLKLKKKLNIENKYMVGFIGRFVEEKGISDLLKAVSLLESDINALLVGNGPIKSKLNKLSLELGLQDRVIFIDSVSNSEISSYINCMNILVLPSRESDIWKEQLGKVLLEAMACEIPVIGSDSGEIPNVIGDSGLIFEAGNYVDLKYKIESIKNGKINSEELTQKAMKRVATIYSWNRIAKNLHTLYRDLMLN
jgi:glycosyltransferase involved in cell wall biosynthesis